MHLARCAAPACETPRLSRTSSLQHRGHGGLSQNDCRDRNNPRAAVCAPRRQHGETWHAQLIRAAVSAPTAGQRAPHL
jgi:hypothetical protein